MRKWSVRFCIIALSIFLITCSKSDEDRLFEMTYPNIRFDIPAGLPGGFVPQALVKVFPTNYESFLTQNGASDETISAIRPSFARLFTLDNVDFSQFVNRISVRICGEDVPECRQVEEVFYLEYDEIRRQRGDDLQLLPTLINAKRLLNNKEFKLEIWFTFLNTTPRTVSCQFDMSFDAVQ